MRILIAEDDRITRRSLQRQLESWGHEVTCAEDGAEAWDAYCAVDFEVIISDWEMPRLSGPELIQRVRDDDRPHYAYVIMLTARAGKEDLVAGMEAGADDFLTKPFEKNELRVRLRAGERIIRLERKLADQNELLSSANRRMKRDLEAAARVQQSLLPKTAPDLPTVDCAWRYHPCDELAGDALNVFVLDDRFLCAYVLDVSGHGVPAALLSVAVARSLSDDPSSVIIGTSGDGDLGRFARPSEVATRLNQRFPFEANGRRFFTMIYALLDLEAGRLTFSCAAHPGPVLVRPDGHVESFELPSPMVGVTARPVYEDQSILLEPGDRVYFYSDGIVEQSSPDGEQFGKDRLGATLRAARSRPLIESVAGVTAEVSAWARHDGFDDDVSLVGLHWMGASGRA